MSPYIYLSTLATTFSHLGCICRNLPSCCTSMNGLLLYQSRLSDQLFAWLAQFTGSNRKVLSYHYSASSWQALVRQYIVTKVQITTIGMFSEEEWTNMHACRTITLHIAAKLSPSREEDGERATCISLAGGVRTPRTPCTHIPPSQRPAVRHFFTTTTTAEVVTPRACKLVHAAPPCISLPTSTT